MGNSLRTFIAIQLDREIQESLRGIQDHLQKSGADVKWVKPENIHLTLKFLGDVAEEKINDVIQAVTISLTGYGTENNFSG